jgi:apolipoprotein N-acyltransferase
MNFLPFASAVLFFLSFHPVNLGPLAWGALIPLIVFALREPNGKRVFLYSWFAGAIFFIAGLFWIRHTAFFGPFGVGIYKGLYWALFALMLRRLCFRAGWPVALAAPVAWVTTEYVRSHLVGGLPWLLAGYSQHEALGVIQIADLGGAWLVSLLVLFVNGVAAQAYLQPERRRAWAAAALGSVALSLIYGTIRLSNLPTESGPVVGIVQPNIPQDVKNVGRSDPHESRRIFDKHVQLTRDLVQRSPEVALVVWPESVFQAGLYYHPASDRWMHTIRFDLLQESVQLFNRPLVGGFLVGNLLKPGDKNTPEQDLLFDMDMDKDLEPTNSALLFDAQGNVAARYDKIQLVQFTEAMPFEPWIPVKKIVASLLKVTKVYEFKRGKGPTVFDIAGRKVGVCICSENYYPDIWREVARNGASAIVNISNEAWFRESAELDLMHAMAKFRAVENRVAAVRGTNSGISAVLDAGGRAVRTLEGPDGKRKAVEGTMAVAMPAGPGGTVYGRVGDAAAWLAAGAALAGLCWSAFFSKR